MENPQKIRDVLPSFVHAMAQLHRLMDDPRDRTFQNRASLAQVKVAGHVFSRGRKGIPAKDIAREEGVTPGAVSQTVALLEKKGMVERVRVAEDRRSARIVLTAEGRKAIDRRNAGFSRLADRLFADIPAADQAIFVSVLLRMCERLDTAVQDLTQPRGTRAEKDSPDVTYCFSSNTCKTEKEK